MVKLSTVAAACWLSSFALLAAEPSKIPHGTVELVSSVKTISPGSSVHVGLLFRLEPGWHIYWKNPGDSGQPPRLSWQLPEGLQAGPIEWPTPKRLPIGNLLDYGYEGDVLLPITVEAAKTLRANSTQTLAANLRVLVCRETCIPGKAALSLTLPVKAGSSQTVEATRAFFVQANEAKPGPLPDGWRISAKQDNASIFLSVAGASAEGKLSFMPGSPNVIENAAPQNVSIDQDSKRIQLKKPADAAGSTPSMEGLLFHEQPGKPTEAYLIATSIEAAPAPPAAQKPLTAAAPAQGLFTILLLAFGGGVILNLMPCVFPVLSIKVLSLLDHSQGEKRTIQMSALLYTAGILVSFWVLVGVLLALRSAGRSLGWGFQLQAPGFVAFLICLLFVLGLSLMGTFEIGTSLMNTGSSLTHRGKYSSSFFTGVLATVVATPCTAPLMGVAVGFALGQPPVTCVAVFTVMALGLASPFLLLSLLPGLSRFLPRPGAWMETLKQVMAFPVFATVIWLLWVLGQQAGMNQVAILLLALLCLAIAGWMAGRWPTNRAVKTAAVVLGLAITAYSSTVLTAVPPITVEASASSANGLKWETFSPEKLASYRAAGKPVLVDFTAAWCLTCQVNDRVVFHSPDVERHLNRSNIALLRADWTSYDPVITDWLAKFGRSGIPFYVVYSGMGDSAPLTLPDGLMTPSGFLEHLKKVNL